MAPHTKNPGAAARQAAHLASVATAMPARSIDREGTVAALAQLFPDEEESFLRNLVERSGVEQRFVVPTVQEVLAPTTFTERNARYHLAALELGERAARTALERARLAPGEIDVLIDVSCTGIAIPALDVGLSPRLGLRADVRRIPITESGCAAGGLALGLASSFARHGERVLIVAVELCSLTLGAGDRSRTNLVASVLFGDGAAAAVVAPRGPGPRIAAVGSHLFPNTRDAMGFHVGEHGLRIVLQRELPRVLAEGLPGAVASFLSANGRTLAGIGLHLVHPGGKRILETYQDLFGLGVEDLRFSHEALRRYGNLSSAAIFTVLELALLSGVHLRKEQEALMVAVGPGLSLELALLDWEDAQR
jgi:alkylresorcinol/alkylpyrone synthase